MSKCVHFGGALLNVSDGPDLDIEVDGKVFHFEFDSRWGPLVVGKRGQEVKQPGPRHKFWKAVTWWREQGQRSDNGKCIWEPEDPFKGFIQINKRTWVAEESYKRVVARIQAKKGGMPSK